MKCPYCGSERIEEGIPWGQTAEVGNIGLRFVHGKVLKLVGVAEVYSDLCLDCGTIVRTYIKADTDEQWYHGQE